MMDRTRSNWQNVSANRTISPNTAASTSILLDTEGSTDECDKDNSQQTVFGMAFDDHGNFGDSVPASSFWVEPAAFQAFELAAPSDAGASRRPCHVLTNHLYLPPPQLPPLLLLAPSYHHLYLTHHRHHHHLAILPHLAFVSL